MRTITLNEQEANLLHDLIVNSKNELFEFCRKHYYMDLNTDSYIQQLEALENKILSHTDTE
jgi:hypothetical protein